MAARSQLGDRAPRRHRVVDAGQNPDDAGDLFRRPSTSAEDRLNARLPEAGLDPAEVIQHVITHLHADHVHEAGTLPNATVLCGANDWQAAHRRAGRLRGLVVPETLREVTTVDFADEAVGPFPASHRLTADGAIRLLPTPGHTSGHLSVLVDEGAGPRRLIAGDAVFSEAQLLRGGIDGVSASGGAARQTVERLRDLCAQAPTVVLPTHDPKAVSRLEDGKTTHVESSV
jgi:N-acyl homoserine lactone hydrolase